MNGSRSNTPRPGAYGDRSSLDALNRTIEGLEARIEGLMGTVARDPRRAPPERDEPSRADPIAEIMQRQRTLTAGRERDVPRERPEIRSPEPRGYSERRPEPMRTQPRSASDFPVEDTSNTRLRATPSRDEQVRRDAPRQEPLRQEAFRQEPRSPENLRPTENLRPQRTFAETQRPDMQRPDTRHIEPQRAEPQRADAQTAEIAKALVGLRQELKKDLSEGLSREMAGLRAELRGITAEAAQEQTVAEDIRGDLQKLSDSINQLGRQASPSQADALKVEFDELRNMIDGLAREDSVRRMETRWTGVEDRMNAFDANRDDELVALAYRLDEIKSQIGSMNSSPAIHALEDKLVSVAQAIELIGRHMQPDDRRLVSQFADLDARLDEISRAIVASGRTAVPDMAGVNRVENRIVDLARQIDSLQNPADNGLSARIEALTARVEELAGEEAAARLEERIDQLSLMLERSQKASAQPDLTGYLSDISHKIDALDQGTFNDALAERLDDLARRIDQLDMPVVQPETDRFDRLEGQLSDIALRLEETHAAPFDDSEILRSLQDQIANLSSLVSEPRETAPSVVPAEFEGRMNALEDYLATSDEYIIEAARQAAEAVMEAYGRNGAGHASSAGSGADLAAISALADDLKVLENLSRSSEERTARTFEALHETLVHIAEKLERLEERGFEHQEEPRTFGTRSLDTNPSMPKAAEPVFGAGDGLAEVDFGRRHDDVEEDMYGRAEDEEQVAPSREEVAAAVQSEQASVHLDDVKTTAAPAKAGLLAGLTKRFSSKNSESPKGGERQLVAPTPSLDASEAIEPDVANQLLEPGSGVPDVKKILERVRAGQTGRNAPPSEADKADFIAAARRAAQLAAEESDDLNRARGGAAASPMSSFSRHRRPLLMAVGAVLLAIMSYPLVNTLLLGDEAPIAPVAMIDQPASTPAVIDEPVETEQMTASTLPASENEEQAVEPLTSLQPQIEEAGETAPVTAEEDVILPEGSETGIEAPVQAGQTGVETGASKMLAPAGTVETATGGMMAQQAGTEQAALAAPTAGAAITVPAEIKPEALAEAARNGDPQALFEVGAIYTEGRGIKANFAEAAKWYQRAADAGVTPAEYRLASLYEKGTGVGRDLKKARALYEKAAEKGNASAMHNLAVMLAGGVESAPDFAAAGKWFSMAADRGIRDSQFNLAILYARGNGVTQDLEESYKWFSIAARDGDADAAQKRDEVAKALSADQLKSAKAKFEAWKITPLDDSANSVAVPDSWVGAGVKTASVDMKKALRNIQAILNNNGFDTGKPDGEMGKKTIAAIKAFQKSIGQEPTGEITDALVKELLKRNEG